MDILFFGDSNTYGYNPNNAMRLDSDTRFVGRLQQKYQGTHNIISEGLNGRTTVFRDPISPDLCGIDYISPCLKSHASIDLLVIMLGTNDVKERFNANASLIAIGMKTLIEKALTVPFLFNNSPKILLVCPPPIKNGVYDKVSTMGHGCEQKSIELSTEYRKIADILDVDFINAGDFAEFSDVDNMHFDQAGHQAMFDMYCDYIDKL